ncbi:MAG: acyl-CoA dehydrogenase family protein [Deltaproteobacteria bacterium]|nr:acyl-CoA dehydrogenase family protein [Deltaproteobacteria bacterium]
MRIMGSIYQQEHKSLQESIRRFSEKHITPFVSSWEEAHGFPSALLEKLGEQGFLGILVEEGLGGCGGDYIMAGAWCEEFGKIPSVGLTTAVNMHSLVITPALAQHGSVEAKNIWLTKALKGQAIGAYAFTEPGAGSDLAMIRTKAVKDGDYFIINGAKTFITNGARANFVLLLTRTDANRGYGGFTTFVVDTSLAGFKVTKTLSKMGWHCSDTAELAFNDVKVHKSMIIGTLNDGWYIAMKSLEWERLMLALTALGGARACLEKTISYVNDRIVFGRPVASYDNTREKLAVFWSKLKSTEALCHRCLKLLNANKNCRKEVSLAKLFVCELAIDIADSCLQMHGGYGYTTEFIVERWLRDLRLLTIGGGTSEVMAMAAARAM